MMDYKPDGRFRVIPLSELREFIDKALQYKFVAVDTETYYDATHPELLNKYIKGKPQNLPFIVTMSLSSQGGYKIYINEDTWPLILEVLQSHSVTKVMYNADYDIWMLQNANILFGGKWEGTIQGPVIDVMHLHHLVNEEDKNESGKYIRDLKGCSNKYIDNDADRFEQLVDQARVAIAKERECLKEDVSYKDVDDYCQDLMTDYASSDTMYTMGLFKMWFPLVDKWNMRTVFDIECACIPVINRMERHGIKVDMAKAMELKEITVKALEQAKKDIFNIAGYEFDISTDEYDNDTDEEQDAFNVRSGDALLKVLQALGIDYQWRNAKGNITLDSDHLALVDHPIIEKILEYRRQHKLLNTYIENIIFYTQSDGRIHPTYWQTGARTGRMSSSNPNFQNLDPDVKCCFIPEDGYIAFFVDYKSQEYKVLAHYADEQAFIDAVNNGQDIHTMTASMVLNKPYEDITSSERKQKGKVANFSTVYGIGQAAMAKNMGEKIDPDTYKRGQAVLTRLGYKPWQMPTLDVVLAKITEPLEIEDVKYIYKPETFKSIGVAKTFKAAYFKKFPKIKEYIDKTRQETELQGFIRTYYGSIKRYDDPKREAYKGVNAQIQGTSAYITKLSLIELDRLLLHKKSHMVNTVHDSGEMEIHLSELDLIPRIIELMERHEFKLPIGVDAEYSTTRWSEKKEWTGVIE
jgi:DNA polymerase-1